MESLAKTFTLFVVVLVFMLVAGSRVNAQSTTSAMDYDIDDDRLIEISTLEQLNAVRYDLDGDGVPDLSDDQADYFHAFQSPISRLGCPAGGCAGYELAQNLDFDDPDSYASGSVDRGWSRGESGEGWLPIGSHFDRFASTFDGNLHTIANLIMYRDADYVGLFGAISSAGSIHQVGLVEVEVHGRSRVGPLAGGNGGTIIDSYAMGSVSGTHTVGGLVGSNESDGTIIESYALCHVSGTSVTGGLSGGNWGTIIGSHAAGNVSGASTTFGVTVGGLVGFNSGTIGTSYATGDVSGSRTVGGLVGSNNQGGEIILSYATGDVSGSRSDTRVGGLVGENYNTIRASYATGSVSGRSRIGGLIGANFVYSKIVSSYATGAVSGDGSIGGLVGYNDNRSVIIGSYSTGNVSASGVGGGLVGHHANPDGIAASYWNIETSSQSRGTGGGFISGAEGKTTAELQAPISYTGIYQNWNTDIDDADGDGYETTGVDDPWHFGTDNQYPALRADFDGDGEATWEEFGLQHREGPPPSEVDVPLQPNTVVTPPVTSSPSCTNGIVVENPQERPGLVSDCTILVQSRDLLAGRATLNWSTDISIARWHGITVQGSPLRVVELQLNSRFISGRIPPQLGKLSALRVLNFSINDLTGGIPPELAGLSELRMLNLHGNLELGGAIPPELGDLSKLEHLNLDATGLTGSIPTELSKLSNLQELQLGQNRLSGSIPREFSSLSSLQYLILHQNDLTGPIPPELAELSKLESLFIRTNRLTGSIPPELGGLSNLRTLNLSENRLAGQIPKELANLSELDSLRLRGNQLTGEIPTWISGLFRLDSLDLSRNQFTGPIPAGLGDLSSLTLLYLHNNNLNGDIPSALGRLHRLRDLKLDHNNLIGPIPNELANLLRLQVMGLSHNDLTGDIPPSLGNLSELWALLLQNNRLTGSIPPELADLSKLQWLRLNDNLLTGSIPFELTALSTLVELHLIGNDLTGCVPWHLAHNLILEISHDRLPKCPPPVAEGGMFSIEASVLLDNNALSIVAVGEAVNGMVSLDGTTITYTHDGSETTEDSFTYTAIDGIHAFTVTLTVTVTPVNDSPIGVADTVAVDEGGTLFIETPALLDNDIDAENDSLSIVAVSDAVNGAIFLDGTTITYEHDGSETTTDSFSYAVSDGTVTDTTMVTITVTPLNDLPVAVGDTATVAEGNMLSIEASVLLGNDTDEEDDPLTVVAVGDGVNGTVVLDGTTVTYAHDGSETVTGSFSYTASDGTDTSTALVMVAITAVNDPPVAVTDTTTVAEGNAVRMEASALLRNDADVENDALSVTAVGDAVNGTVTLDGTTIAYRHDGSETAVGSFSYTVSDGTVTDTTMVTITVTPLNDLPVAVGDTATVAEGNILSIEASVLLGNDTDEEDDPLTVVAVGDGVNGTVVLDGTTVTYAHDGSETVTGSFSYTASDGTDTSTALVMVAVTAVNDPPVAVTDTTTVAEGNAVRMEASALLRNDADVENDALSVTAVGDAVNGTVTLDGTTIAYRHDGSETAVGSFSYTASDGVDFDTATVTITVTPVNDPPVAAADTATVAKGNALPIEASVLLRNDTDAENDPLSITAVGDAVNGTVVLDGMTITYEHDGSETTSGSFLYTVSDGTDTDTAMVKLTTTETPVAPADDGVVNVGIIVLTVLLAVAAAGGGALIVMRRRGSG